MSEDPVVAVPALRVVRGEPTPEELAVLIAIAGASGGDESGAETPARGRWNDPAWNHRGRLLPGPGAWRSAASSQ